MKKLLSLWILGLSLFGLVACDDGESKDESEDQNPIEDIQEVEVDLDIEEIEDLDETEIADAEEGDSELEVEIAEDLFEVYDKPTIFRVVFLDHEMAREVLYMVGGSSITLPDMQIRAEDINYDPIVGQPVTFTFPSPSSRAEPMISTTDENGETEILTLVLQGETEGANANFFFTPHFKGLAPSPLWEKRVQGVGMKVDWVRPTDAEGNIIPMLADPEQVYMTTIELSRFDDLPISQDLEVELEFVRDGGSFPLSVDGSDESLHRWSVDPDNPIIDLPLVATVEDSRTAFFYLRFYQRGSKHGSKQLSVSLE